MSLRAAAVVLAVLVAAPLTAGQPADNAPITVQVTSSMAGERGLGRLLTSAAEGNTAETASDVERDLAAMRWVRVVPVDPEVLVTIERRSRTEPSRTRDKEGRESVTHRYVARGLVAILGDRLSVEAETTFTQGPDAYRDDAAQFKTVARDLSARVTARIWERLDDLRPRRSQAGFTHQPKYKLLFKGDGLEVTSVEPGSPAERAGLQVKDRIRNIDGEKGTDQMNARALEWWIEPAGTLVKLEVERQKQRRPVELTLLPIGRWGSGAIGSAASAATSAGSPPMPAAALVAPSKKSQAAAPTGKSTASVELKPGMTQAQVLAALGEPVKKVAFGARTIWSYPGFNVTFLDGRVVDVK